MNVRTDAKYHALHETLQSRFPLATLGELVSIKPSYGSSTRAVTRTNPSQPRYIRITDYGDDGIESGHEFVTAESVDNRYELMADDLLFARSGSVGKTYLHEDDSESAIFAGYCIRFRFNESRVLPRFAYWWTKTQAYEKWVATIQRPSVQANINMGEFESCQIPLPPVQIQDGLVAAMDAARAQRKAQLAEADALLAGIDGFVLDILGIRPPPADTRRVFAVNLIELAKRLDSEFNHPRYKSLAAVLDQTSTETNELGNILVSISSGATPNRSDASLYAESGVKFLRILNIENGEINYRDLKHISDAVHDGQLSRSQLAADDVLMTITGRVGSAAVVQGEHLPANINQHIVRMRIDQNRCLPEFLSIWLNSKTGLEISNRLVSGGTRAALDYEAIRKIRIPLPASLDIQENIVNRTKEIRQQARRLRAAAEAGWRAAKQRFEAALLGDNPP